MILTSIGKKSPTSKYTFILILFKIIKSKFFHQDKIINKLKPF